jgi:AraC-like DNA-binding protein
MTGKEKNEIRNVFEHAISGQLFENEFFAISIFKTQALPIRIELSEVTCLLVCITGQYEVKTENNIFVLDTLTFTASSSTKKSSLKLSGKTPDSELLLLTYKGKFEECLQFIDSTLLEEAYSKLSNEIIEGSWLKPVDFDQEATRFFHYSRLIRISYPLMAAYYKVKFKEIWLLAIGSLLFHTQGSINNLPEEAIKQMKKVKHILSTRYSEPLTLKEIAHEVGTNEFSLKKNFKLLFGKTVFQYWTAIKMGMARRWILDSQLNVSEVAEKLGYMHPTHFSAAFKKHFGYLPHTLKRH